MNIIWKPQIEFFKNRYPELYKIFSLKHENEITERDIHKRVLFKHIKNIINPYNPTISKILIENDLLRPIYPNNKKACIILTHDIDNIKHTFKWLLYYWFKDIINFSWNRWLKRFLWYIFPKYDLLKNFQKIINIEKKYNAKSTFFFMATEDSDKRYNISELKNELKSIIKQWWEIWLHWGYDKSAFDLNTLIEEKNRLEKILWKKIIWIRQHYLRFNEKITFKIHKETGFKYDTTLWFADQIWFRNLVCHPFNPIDLESDNIIEDYYEIPMIIMDWTLFWYMNLSFDKAWKEAKIILDQVIKYKWCVSILWHNDQFDDSRHPWSLAFYEKMLVYLFKNNIWLTNWEEFIRFIKNKQN